MNLIEQKNELIKTIENLLKLKINNCFTKEKAIKTLDKIKSLPCENYYDLIHLQVREDIKQMKKEGKINISKEKIDEIIKNSINKYSQ